MLLSKMRASISSWQFAKIEYLTLMGVLWSQPTASTIYKCVVKHIREFQSTPDSLYCS